MTLPGDTRTTGQPIDDAALLADIRTAKGKAVQWLTDRVADDGAPEGAEIANSWWRAPWGLVVAGALDVAAAMMGWVERNALDDDGDFRAGPFGFDDTSSPVYHLSPLAISSWLLGRYDTAELIMGRLAHFQDPGSGGAFENRHYSADPLQDTLKTSQLGISALVTGHREMAEGVHGWLRQNYADQRDLPTRLYTSRRHGALVTDTTDAPFMRVVDFTATRQAYFQSGIASAFLAGHAQQTGDADVLELSRKYLSLNTGGTDRQFDDPTSVQVCKFGWGAAAMLTADRGGDHLPWVQKMGAWFVDRQNPDGSWSPASAFTPKPGMLDFYWKTSEHLMELSYIELALLAHRQTPITP